MADLSKIFPGTHSSTLFHLLYRSSSEIRSEEDAISSGTASSHHRQGRRRAYLERAPTQYVRMCLAA